MKGSCVAHLFDHGPFLHDVPTSPWHIIDQSAPRLLCVRKRRNVPTHAILSNYSVFYDLDQNVCVSDRKSSQHNAVLAQTPLFQFLADLLYSKLYNVCNKATTNRSNGVWAL